MTTKLFHWRPTIETLFAFISAIIMLPVYYVGSHNSNNSLGFFVFLIFGNLFLNVLFPVFYISFVKKSSLSDLAITSHLWLKSLLISLFIMLTSIPQLLHVAGNHSSHAIFHQLLFNFLSLWEPFFVFCWLLLCFNRAFGAVFAVVLTIICFIGYHVGSYPVEAMLPLAIVGGIFSILFLFIKNILLLWPFAWGVSATIGTLQSSLSFSWSDIFISVIILLIQLAFILYALKRNLSLKQTEQ